VEFVSKSSLREDLREKKVLYARLGVHEYYVFDPEQSCMEPPLQGFRLHGTKYVAIPAEPDGSLSCLELGLRLLAEGPYLRLLQGKSGEPILSPLERADQQYQRAEQLHQRAEQERQRAEQERQRADTLAAEVEHLRAELERLARKPK
jgi:hypothetical protein